MTMNTERGSQTNLNLNPCFGIAGVEHQFFTTFDSCEKQMRMKPVAHRRSAAAVIIIAVFTSLLFAAVPPPRRYVVESYPSTLNTNMVSITLETLGEVPEFVAVSVRQEKPEFSTGHERAIEQLKAALERNRNLKWLPFQTNLVIDLGPGDGERQILFSYKYKGQAFDGSGSGSSITIQRGTPTLRIVNPTNFLSSQPVIQLQGLTSRRFETLRFEQFNSGGNKVASEQQGLGTSFYGGYDFKYSDNHFSFLDVDLSPGKNTFVFHGTDEFGNEMKTNMMIVFSTAHDHTAPFIEVDWPKPNAELAGANYTIRGRMDDFSARLEASIRTNDSSKTYEALVERNGYFWIEDIPLALAANQITLTATDAAGNRSETNFTIIGFDGPIITMDPVTPPDLWKQFIDVTGRVTPPNHDVWINGLQAKVETDGTWWAKSVPVLSPNGGTAVFDMSAVPKSGTPANKAGFGEFLSAQTSLGTNAVILNASAPACGAFRLHLTKTEGKSFVILESTNLIEWTPILTNINAAPNFDFTQGTTNHACRFFKLVPLP